MDNKIEKQKIDLNHKTILVTGAAGFIGSNLVLRLLNDLDGSTIVGIDCLTDYNPLELKEWRLGQVKAAAEKSKSDWIWVKGDSADKGLLHRPREGQSTVHRRDNRHPRADNVARDRHTADQPVRLAFHVHRPCRGGGGVHGHVGPLHAFELGDQA